MAYDENMVARFRKALSKFENISEKIMMGGVCFFYQGNMIGGCSGQKVDDMNFMFRVGKSNEAEALKREGAVPVVLGKRKMGGMVFVNEKHCDNIEMANWVKLTFEFVGSLPPKD